MFQLLLQVIDPINKLIDTVEFDAAFYSLDWHPADHVSFIDNIKQRPIYPTSPVSIKTWLSSTAIVIMLNLMFDFNIIMVEGDTIV